MVRSCKLKKTGREEFGIQGVYEFNYEQVQFEMAIRISIGRWGLPWVSADKRIHLQCGSLGSIPGLGNSPGEGKGYPLQYSGLENSMDCIVHGITMSQT